MRRLIDAADPTRISRPMIELMYGTGMPVSEVCTPRIRDIDLSRAQIIIRAPKGEKDRIVRLAASFGPRLHARVDAAGGGMGSGGPMASGLFLHRPV